MSERWQERWLADAEIGGTGVDLIGTLRGSGRRGVFDFEHIRSVHRADPGAEAGVSTGAALLQFRSAAPRLAATVRKRLEMAVGHL